MEVQWWQCCWSTLLCLLDGRKDDASSGEGFARIGWWRGKKVKDNVHFHSWQQHTDRMKMALGFILRVSVCGEPQMSAEIYMMMLPCWDLLRWFSIFHDAILFRARIPRANGSTHRVGYQPNRINKTEKQMSAEWSMTSKNVQTWVEEHIDTKTTQGSTSLQFGSERNHPEVVWLLVRQCAWLISESLK